jgi:hypothetical protein
MKLSPTLVFKAANKTYRSILNDVSFAPFWTFFANLAVIGSSCL